MAQRKSDTVATTLYRINGVTTLRAAFREKYLEAGDFEYTTCKVGDRESALLRGHMITDHAKWADQVTTLIGSPVDARNVTSAAVLLVPSRGETLWALSFGMGFLLLEQAFVDPGFGQRFAIRVANGDQLSSLTRKTMDDRAKIDRSSIPSGDHLRGFGIGGFGELVTRLVATAELPELTVGKSFKLRGADALNIPLARNAESLLSDLDSIEAALNRPPLEDLAVLEQLVALKKGSYIVTQLDLALKNVLERPDTAFGCAWPHESVNENGTPASFRIKGHGKPDSCAGVPTADDIKAAVGNGDVLASLERVKIQLFSDPDGDNLISPDIPLRRWIAFEADRDGRRYFLHDGAWYLMDDDYAAQLQRRVQSIFERYAPVALVPWPRDPDGDLIAEQDFNKLAARACGGAVLDRKLVRTTQNPRGFETCDIFTADGILVHVKNIDSSAPASHLFAQGANSAHAISSDEEARDRFRERVAAAGGDPDQVRNKPPAVVFAIARKSGAPFAADSLYSFSQVTLVRTFDDLEARGIPAFVLSLETDSC